MTAEMQPLAPRFSLWYACTFLTLILLAFVLSLFLGVADISVHDVLAVLKGAGTPEARSIIMDIRLPRILTGILAGMQLAVAGLLLQTITRNPLADPSIMGISQGATLSVTLFLLLTVYIHLTGSTALATLPLAWLPAIGTLGGLVAGVLIYGLALRNNLGPIRITLCGIAVGAVLHALAIGLIAGWGSNRLEVLIEWLSGSLYARSWEHVRFLLPWSIVALGALPFIHRSLEMLRFDSTVARSFGFSYQRQFTLQLLLSCVLAASAVGTVGPIVFIGLVVPHLARAIAGHHFRLMIPLTLGLGAITVTLGDLVGRLIGHENEIPIGVITAVFGAPVLIFLLRKIA
ncbi:iron ABC transporter permease [Erwinia sp. S63]|uniref:FecCD family ABC transporter permease n=1 Tax=Erwinia sp. S63 TaxID=2769341 RepID=UPI001909FB51|nr:iron ABC transporter permease [Erwinia sp. S63]